MNGKKCDVCRKALPCDEGTMIESEGREIRSCNQCLIRINEALEAADIYLGVRSQIERKIEDFER